MPIRRDLESPNERDARVAELWRSLHAPTSTANPPSSAASGALAAAGIGSGRHAWTGKRGAGSGAAGEVADGDEQCLDLAGLREGLRRIDHRE